MNEQDLKYSKYLQKRRITGLIYRYIFVYPFFLRYLGKRNFDYGCGVGDFLKFADIFKIKITGLDINTENIKVCKNRKYDAQLLGSNSDYFNNLRNSADCIVMDNVLEHIQRPEKIIKDISQGLKPSGNLVIAIPVGEKGYQSDPDHKIYYDELKLEKLMKSYSFERVIFFYRPFKNKWLRDNLRQFCYYAVYRKIKQ